MAEGGGLNARFYPVQGWYRIFDLNGKIFSLACGLTFALFDFNGVKLDSEIALRVVDLIFDLREPST